MDSQGAETGKNPEPVGRAKGYANLRVGGGRPAGVPNKSTERLRKAISDLLDANAEKLPGMLDEIREEHGAMAAWKCLADLYEYALPKLARHEIDATIRRPEEDMADDELASALDHFRMMARQKQAKETA